MEGFGSDGRVQRISSMEKSADMGIRRFNADNRFSWKYIALVKSKGVEMTVKDYWVYQQRQNETNQWAIYVVKEFSRGKPEATVLDFTIYSEDIDTKTNSISYVGWHYSNAKSYTDALICEMVNFTSMNAQDYDQIKQAIERILEG